MSDDRLGTATVYRHPIFRLPTLNGIREGVARKMIRWAMDLLPEQSNGVSHARTELEIAGLLKPDSDYGGMLGNAVIDMMKLFSLEGHSGFSAGMTIGIFEKVSRFEPLTPLMGTDDEWLIHNFSDGTYAQNKRCGRVFKDANGSAYDIDGRVFREPSGACFTSSESRVPVTFPYTPTTEYVDVPASE